MARPVKGGNQEMDKDTYERSYLILHYSSVHACLAMQLAGTKLMGGTTMRCLRSAYNQTIDLNTKVWLLMIVVSLSLVFRPF